MRIQFSKLALAVSFSLAMAFTFSCSSDDGGGGGNNGGISSATVGLSSSVQSSSSANVASSSSFEEGSSSSSSESVSSSSSVQSSCSAEFASSSSLVPSSSSEAVSSSSSSSSVQGNSYSEDVSSSSLVPSSSSAPTQSGIIEGTPVTYQGEIYESVVIGTQTWLRRNLNYAVEGSKCYGNKPANCEIYGRLYTWNMAMSVCPSGWHLPSVEEWFELMSYVDSTGTIDVLSLTAGRYLKATSDWNCGNDGEDTNGGEDTYGFAALPGGQENVTGSFIGAGNSGNWWTSSEIESVNCARDLSMSCSDVVGALMCYGKPNPDEPDKHVLRSVRCVKD